MTVLFPVTPGPRAPVPNNLSDLLRELSGPSSLLRLCSGQQAMSPQPASMGGMQSGQSKESASDSPLLWDHGTQRKGGEL